jgi:hypothetical protein
VSLTTATICQVVVAEADASANSVDTAKEGPRRVETTMA